LIIKTDLDGWDLDFLRELIQEVVAPKNLKAIFSEGPSEIQIRAGEWHDYLSVIDEFMHSGWDCALFTNKGLLYSQIIQKEELFSVYELMKKGLQSGEAPAHFFDFVLIRK
jgi:hypothetical protein